MDRIRRVIGCLGISLVMLGAARFAGAGDVQKTAAPGKIEITFKSAADFEYLKNVTPEVLEIKREGLFSATLSSLKDGINMTGALLFDEGKHQGKEPAVYGNGTYSLDFVVRPAGGYWFGLMLGPGTPKGSFVYARQPSSIVCAAFYNGGAYTLILAVDGEKKESKGLGSWVWDTRWYRMTLMVEANKDITATITNLSSNVVADTIKFSSPAPLGFLPAKLYLVTETCPRMNNFLRLGKMVVAR